MSFKIFTFPGGQEFSVDGDMEKFIMGITDENGETKNCVFTTTDGTSIEAHSIYLIGDPAMPLDARRKMILKK
jgi:hypothetical protein